MSRTRTAVLAGLVLALPLAAGGFIHQSRSERDGARLLDQVFSYVSARYVDTVDANALYEKAAKGLVHELNDPYSVLFSPKEASAFTTQTNGRYAGIGMLIGEVKGNIVIDRVFPHTPAEEAGIQEGDRIVRIDTTSIKGWKTDQVSNTLKGAPGSKVKVSFERPGVTQPIQVTFTRREIRIPAVPYAMILDGNVGYVPLQTFSETASDEVSAAVKKLQGEGARSIVLDLRDNPGGILDQALATSNLFLKRGQEIVSVRGREGAQVYTAQDQPLAPSIPLVVMVDGGSASASEIVTGALQDHDRAVVLGTTSYGKGLVQSLYQLDGGYFLKMTTARYYLPSGRSIQKPRKVVDGKFVAEDETNPDSLEADTVKKNRPAYKSDAGRVVYGGGGVTPDVIVKPDTISTVEQQFLKTLYAKPQDVNAVLQQMTDSLKGTLKSPSYTYNAQWTEDFYQRLARAGLKVDRQHFQQAAPSVQRLIDSRLVRTAFGDSALRRRTVGDDNQLKTALDLLHRGESQQQLLTTAARMQTARKSDR